MGIEADLGSSKKHATGPAKCLHCHHEWEATAEVGVTGFDCPNCELQRGVWYGIMRPPDLSKCTMCRYCNTVAFLVMIDSVMCLSCGIETSFQDLPQFKGTPFFDV